MEEIDLINVVKQHPNLYNKQLASFKNIKFREIVWREISSKMNIPVPECQRMWRNLRERYTKEQRKLKTTSTGLENVSEWHLYGAMAFLKEHIRPRRTSVYRYIQNGLRHPDSSHLNFDASSSLQSCTDLEAAEPIKAEPASSQNELFFEAAVTEGDEIDLDEHVPDHVTNAFEQYKKNSNRQLSDDVYGKYVATVLSELPLKSRNNARKEITRILEKYIDGLADGQ